MTHSNLVLIGFGNVGRSFARLLLRKEAELKERDAITFAITAIATGRHGAALDPNGLDNQRALKLVEESQSLSEIGRAHV